ncbi:MAG: MASE1 domain-containing protein [Pseudomonadota bacterium]|nr:MASE1 domain-containing protein [Pseudomonadota bacterium]
MREDSVSAPSVTAEQQGLPEQEGEWSLARLRRIGALALGYGIAGALGLLIAVPPGYATSVWPSSGIALAGLLLWGTRVWPGIWLGSFFVNVWVAYTAQGDAGPLDYAIAANIAVGSTMQALLAALLLRKWVGVSKLFEVASATVAFAALTAICCLIASTWGVATLKLAGLVEFGTIGESWRTWWLGDFIGILIITPALMTWRQLLPLDSPPGYVVETIGSLVLLTGVTAFVFYYQAPAGVVAYPITFLPLPFLVWIASRTNPGGVSFSLCLVSAIAVVATSNGAGPFARETTSESMLFLQTFMGLTTLMGLTLAAAVCGHKNAAGSLRRLTGQLQQLALTDELTGLRNRRGFLLLADQAWRLARRTRVRCLLMFIDVDGLKYVNDTQGHKAGDELLVDAARVLTEVFRETDVIGRVGGDEFAIVELVDGVEASDAGSKRLRARIEEFNRRGGKPFQLAMSFGIQELPSTGELSLEMLLARADSTMYEKKHARRQRQTDEKLKRPGKSA